MSGPKPSLLRAVPPFGMPGASGFAVVRAHDVEARSRNGWVVSCVVHSTELEAATPHVVDVPLFLMVRSRDEELETLRGQIESARAQFAVVSREVAELKTARGELLAEREAIGSRLADAERELQEAGELAIRSAALRRKLEGDLAKVRREVGEKEWKRITGDVDK
jgi:hypothetical protein